MFIYNTFTIIKAVINRAHCSSILLISFSQISLSPHILYFGLTVLTKLEPSTPLKLHYPIPLSWTLARCFAAPLQALSLVSTRIGRWWTPESLAILPLSRHDMAPSPSAHCFAVTWLPRPPLTASPWHGTLAIRSLPRRDMALLPSAHCLAMTWLHHHPLTTIAVGQVPIGILCVGKMLRYPLVACYITVLSLRLPKEAPREENSVGRLMCWLTTHIKSDCWKMKLLNSNDSV
jgi:hypothetical protein